MSNQITATDAYLIASGKYEERMNKMIGHNLSVIYYKISSVIKAGCMWTNVEIDIIENKYQQKLASLLEEKGFKTSFSYDEIENTSCIRVSWGHVGDENGPSPTPTL